MIVSKDCPPPFLEGVAYWERSQDPAHPDAMKSIQSNARSLVLLLIRGELKSSTGPRKSGWMAIDWIENPIGFIPDGQVMEESPDDFITDVGPFGHICAYPICPEIESYKVAHRKSRELNKRKLV